MTSRKSQASKRPAEIVREYGPFDDAKNVGGISFDGHRIWAATGPALVAIDPDPEVRKNARWALQQIAARKAKAGS